MTRLFANLRQPARDPILALGDLVRSDSRPQKLDLGIGIYVDDRGVSPIMAAVQRAEQRVLDAQLTKAYLSPKGNPAFLERLGSRIFSQKLWTDRVGTIGAMQTVGCLAALRLGAEVLAMTGVRRMWMSKPTWPIHSPIFKAAGLEPLEYQYYENGTTGVLWDAMLADLERARGGDAILLHGCCHNPTGVDLTLDQWEELAALVGRKGVIPFVDVAYAGLGQGWEEDLSGLRLLIDTVEEAVVAVSCSKSFGLYRERVGALFLAGRDVEQTSSALANGLMVARASYSMPPDHGAATVAEILGDPELDAEWQEELGCMRGRIERLRARLADAGVLVGLDWAYLRKQRGMFSLLPLEPAQVARLREECAIYMPIDGRICIPGLSDDSCGYLAESCASLNARGTRGIVSSRASPDS